MGSDTSVPDRRPGLAERHPDVQYEELFEIENDVQMKLCEKYERYMNLRGVSIRRIRDEGGLNSYIANIDW